MFHIDDLMMSHESSTIVTKHVKLLDATHEVNNPLTVARGKPHEFLGMTIDFSLKRSVAVTQNDFVKKLWINLPPDLRVNYRSTPAPHSSFKVDTDAPLLNYVRKEMCHTNTAKMLWTSQRSRPDMQLSTGHHYTRIKLPTVQD